jgi:hypothetical protein
VGVLLWAVRSVDMDRTVCCLVVWLGIAVVGVLLWAVQMTLRIVPAVAKLPVGRPLPESSNGRSDNNKQPHRPSILLRLTKWSLRTAGNEQIWRKATENQ